ncbi:MAG: hypothetical protein HFE87_04650 [Acutalibacter sp.]|nr:hypothetical protein [Acutalibacter sp.]
MEGKNPISSPISGDLRESIARQNIFSSFNRTAPAEKQRLSQRAPGSFMAYF